MPASPKFGGPVLAKCALERKTPLEDQESECVINVHLNGDFFCWEMDHDKIVKAAEDAAREAGEPEALQRCDFAVYQDKNSDDKKSHLILVECKKTFCGERTVEEAHGQLVDGLRVLQHMAGDNANFRFDLLNPVLVYNRRDVYSNATKSGDINSFLHKTPIEYNNGRKARIKKARIKLKSSNVMINDKFIAVRGAR